jgi:hypothetical protein
MRSTRVLVSGTLEVFISYGRAGHVPMSRKQETETLRRGPLTSTLLPDGSVAAGQVIAGGYVGDAHVVSVAVTFGAGAGLLQGARGSVDPV